MWRRRRINYELRVGKIDCKALKDAIPRGSVCNIIGCCYKDGIPTGLKAVNLILDSIKQGWFYSIGVSSL